MARASRGRHALLMLLLCLPLVLGTPFPIPEGEEYQQKQVSLKVNADADHSREDPLKNFISDVAHEKVSLSSSSGGGSSSGYSNSKTIVAEVSDGTTTTTSSSSSSALPELVPMPSSSSSSLLRYALQTSEENNLATRPSWFTSTLLARRLLAKSSVGIASTVYQQTSLLAGPAALEGISVSLPEYIADCSGYIDEYNNNNNNNGNPILLGLYVSTTFRNAAQGSNVSLSIDWWDHLKSTQPLYPDFPLSEAGLPRVSLIGYIEHVDFSSSDDDDDEDDQREKERRLEECFLASHPDARVWLPGNAHSPHAGFWARMVVEQAYWIGGFGDLQQIGWINMTEWRAIGRFKTASGIGDGSGRGWDDVKLPGE